MEYTWIVVLISLVCSSQTSPLPRSDDTNGESLIQRVDRLEALLHQQIESDKTRDGNQAWQSIHLSAAAACRSLTSRGGSGCHWNIVVPLTKGKTCTQVCKSTKTFNECDGEVSIGGLNGKAKSGTSAAGFFYNYGCDSGTAGSFEIGENTDLRATFHPFAYCCCRAPKC